MKKNLFITLVVSCVVSLPATAAEPLPNYKSINASGLKFNMTGFSPTSFYQCLAGQVVAGGAAAFGGTSKNLFDVKGVGGKCPAPVGVRDSISCEEIENQPLDDVMAQISQQNSTTAAAYECQETALSNVTKELGCFNDMASELTKNMSYFQGVYSEGLRKAEESAELLDDIQEDYKTKREFALLKLRPSNDNGTVGLLGLQSQMRNLLAAFPGEVNQQRTLVRQYEESDRLYHRAIEIKTLYNTRVCLEKKTHVNNKSNSRSEVKGYLEHLADVVEGLHYSKLLGGKIIRQNGKNKYRREAARIRADFKSVIDNILAGLPTSGVIPSDPKSATDFTGQSSYTSVEQILRQYRSQLAKFNAGGIDIYQELNKTMNSCQTYAKGQAGLSVAKDPSIKSKQLALESMLDRLRQNVEEKLVKYEQSFLEMAKGLTDKHINLNLDTCRNEKDLNRQVTCMGEVQQQFENLANGKDERYKTKIQVKGAFSEDSITCVGISGCVAKLQETTKDYEVKHNRVKIHKKKYVQDVNRKAGKFLSDLAMAFSGPSAQLKKYVDTLSTTIASFGVSANVSFPTFRGEQLRPRPPHGIVGDVNVLQAVGSKTSPPLLDVTKDNFGTTLSRVGKKTEELRGKKEEALQATTLVQSRAVRCKTKEFNKDSDRVQELVNAFLKDAERLESCAVRRDACSGGDSSIDDLLATASEVDEDLNAIKISSVLYSGIDDVCRRGEAKSQRLTKKQKGYEENYTDLENEKDALESNASFNSNVAALSKATQDRDIAQEQIDTLNDRLKIAEDKDKPAILSELSAERAKLNTQKRTIARLQSEVDTHKEKIGRVEERLAAAKDKADEFENDEGVELGEYEGECHAVTNLNAKLEYISESARSLASEAQRAGFE